MRNLALGVFIGVLGGFLVTANYYNIKIKKSEAVQLAAEKVRNDEIKMLGVRWEERLIAANSAKPDVVTERVFVRANCVQATDAEPLDDGEATVRAQLAERTVRNLEKLAQEKEVKYSECSHRLRALQEALH